METENKKRIKSTSIYFAIIIFTIIVNIPIFLFVAMCFVGDLSNYLSDNVSFLYIRKPIFLWGGGIIRVLSINFMVNIILLLIVVLGAIWLFRKRLNKFFKTNDLFTIKKIGWLAVIVISVQLIISCWMWQIDPQYGEIHPAENELIVDE